MKFLIGRKEDFTGFLNSIGKKDRIAIVSHTDLDGIASALLIREILKSKKIKIKSLNFVDYKKGMFEEISSRLKRIDKIFVADISIDSDYDNFQKFKGKYDVFLLDHHPSDIKELQNTIKTKTEDCTTFVLYELGKSIVNLDKWKSLICATMVSEFSYKDESNFQFIREIYPEITEENINDSIPADISKKIASALVYFNRKEKKIFDFLAKNKLGKLEKYYNIIEEEIRRCVDKFKKEAEFYPERNLYFYYYTPRFNVGSIVTTILSMEQQEKTFIFVSDLGDEEGFVKAGARNQGGKENTNWLMKKGIAGFENSSAGGHFKASGARFMKKDLEEFKKNILEQ